MTKLSAAECYSNKDVITQIYGMMNTIDTSTYKSVSVAREGNSIVFTFTTNDDVAHTFTISDPGIADITSSTSGSQVTISFIMTDGSTKSVTYTATGGVTVDTEQTITAKKTMTAGLDVTGGTLEAATGDIKSLTSTTAEVTMINAKQVNGNAVVGGSVSTTTGIDLEGVYNSKAAKESLTNGDVKQVGTSASPGTSVTAQTVKATSSADLKTATVEGDLTVLGDTEVEKLTVNGDLEAGGAAFEQSTSNDLVISPTNRLIVKTGSGANQELVVGTDSVIVDKLSASTSVSTPSLAATASATVPTVDKSDSSTSAASTAFVVAMTSDTGGTVNNLVHTSGDETALGIKDMYVDYRGVDAPCLGGWVKIYSCTLYSRGTSAHIRLTGVSMNITTYTLIEAILETKRLADNSGGIYECVLMDNASTEMCFGVSGSTLDVWVKSARLIHAEVVDDLFASASGSNPQQRLAVSTDLTSYSVKPNSAAVSEENPTGGYDRVVDGTVIE